MPSLHGKQPHSRAGAKYDHYAEKTAAVPSKFTHRLNRTRENKNAMRINRGLLNKRGLRRFWISTLYFKILHLFQKSSNRLTKMLFWPHFSEHRRPVVFWAGKGGVIGWTEPEGEGFGALACSGGAFPAASRPSHRPRGPGPKGNGSAGAAAPICRFLSKNVFVFNVRQKNNQHHYRQRRCFDRPLAPASHGRRQRKALDRDRLLRATEHRASPGSGRMAKGQEAASREDRRGNGILVRTMKLLFI